MEAELKLETEHQSNWSYLLNLIIFLSVTYLVFINFYTSLTVLPMYVISLGGSEFFAGLQATLFYIAAVIMRIYFGPLTDTKGRKQPLIIGTVAFGTAPLLFLLSQNIWMLMLARIYQAVGLAAFLSSGSSLVADLAPQSKLGTYMGIYRLVNTFALLSGPAIAMIIIKNFNYSVWFQLAFILGLLSIAMMLLVRAPKVTLSQSRDSLKWFIEVLNNRLFWPVYGSIAVVSVGYGVLLTFASLFLSQATELSNPAIYFTYFGLAGIVGNLSAGYLSDRFGRIRIIIPSLFLLGVGTLILFFASAAAWLLFISSILAGLGFSGGLLTAIAWLIDLADTKLRGTVLAIQESTIDLSIGLGSFLFGIASGWVGMGIAFAAAGFFIALSAGCLLIIQRSL